MRLGQRNLNVAVKLVGFLAGVYAAHHVLLATLATERYQAAVCDNESPTTITPATQASARRVRIFCLILTHPKQYETMATNVNNTWARRCDKYYFVGSEPNNFSLPMLQLPIVESRRMLWQKVRMTFEIIYARERLDDFDFFLKADDDTYILLENLRHLLRDKDPNQAAIFGRRFAYEGNKKLHYMSGGAGYVLSRQAVRDLVSRGFAGKESRQGVTDYCNIDYISVEDWLMGRCLSQLGVSFDNSLDQAKRERFHPVNPEGMTNPKDGPDWLKLYNYYPFEKCVECISNTSISFHYVYNVLELEFLLYHIKIATSDTLMR